MPISVIRHLEKYELPGPEGIHSLDIPALAIIAEKAIALTDRVKVATRAHTKLLHIVLFVKL